MFELVFVRFVVLPVLVVLPVFVFVTTGVETGVLVAVVLARFAFVFVLVTVLFAAPPQAMPRAPRAKTDESAIAFFILFFKSPVFFKD